jgi:membrane protein DedA with SNARE-associated domain
VARQLRRTVPFILFLSPWPAACGFLAGAVRIRPWVFASLATIGQLVWAFLWYRAGQALGTWMEPLIALLGRHVWWATTATVLLVAIGVWWRRRRRGVPDLESEAKTPGAP